MSVLRRVQAAQSVWVTNQALLFLFRHDDQRQAYLGGPQIVTDNKTSESPPPSTDRVVGLDMRAPSSLTFGSRSSDASVEDAATLRARMAGGLPPVFTRQSRNRSSLLPDAPTPRPPQRQVVDHFPAALVRVCARQRVHGRSERRPLRAWADEDDSGAPLLLLAAVGTSERDDTARGAALLCRRVLRGEASQNGPSQTRAHTPGPWRAARRARPIRDDFDSPHIGRRRRALDTPHTARRRSRRPLLRTLLATFPATPLVPALSAVLFSLVQMAQPPTIHTAIAFLASYSTPRESPAGISQTTATSACVGSAIPPTASSAKTTGRHGAAGTPPAPISPGSSAAATISTSGTPKASAFDIVHVLRFVQYPTARPLLFALRSLLPVMWEW
ncbi:hypothetical protein B0H14DRAFT_3736769 [Mycena olivaceomarginata]|nr:hypothetical protein B0H14DRAFT_3736769 [Mycena olivaceomarginata]